MDASHVSDLHDSQDYGTAELDSGDRLSELPDSLLLVILSLLHIRDAVRTTILSKRWENLWIAIPCIDLCRLDYSLSRDFICGVFAQWKGAKILKISFRFFSYLPQPNDLDSWLLFAIEKQVEELVLELARLRPVDEYCVPQHLYSCSTLTKLSLIRCDLIVEENVQWNQLKRLKIKGLKALSEDALNRILSGSPLLEELILCFWKITDQNLSIRSNSLKILHIGRYDRGFSGEVTNAMLLIQAPNLLTLEISAFFSVVSNYYLDVPSLSNAILRFETLEAENILLRLSASRLFCHVFPSICHVETITLSVFCTQFFVYLKKENVIMPFSNAKFLELYASEAEEILHVLEMFPMLMMLKVLLDQELDHDLSGEGIHAALVDACNSSAAKMTSLPCPPLIQLKTVEISWCLREPSIIPAIEIMLENADMLEKMVVQLGTYSANPETFTLAEEKVMSMPRSSPTAQLIVIKG